MLSAPANGATGVAVPVTLSWGAATGATSYQAQVSTSSTFATLVLDRPGITTTSTSVSGLAAISTQLEEAVRSLGGSQLTSVRHVIVPLLRKHLLSGWILVFILAIRELSVVVFLAGPGSRTISMLLLDYSESGNLELAAALGLVLLSITLIVVVAGHALLGRDLLSRSQ